eukprot:6352878-Prymnesium_polylepis.1
MSRSTRFGFHFLHPTTTFARGTGSTGIKTASHVGRRLARLRVKRRESPFLGSSTPPCPASEARQMERGTLRARTSEPSKASAPSRPISKAPKASSTSVSTAQRRAGARRFVERGAWRVALLEACPR